MSNVRKEFERRIQKHFDSGSLDIKFCPASLEKLSQRPTAEGLMDSWNKLDEAFEKTGGKVIDLLDPECPLNV